MTDLLYETATELATRIASKDLSAVELMQASLDRIDAVNETVNAVVSLRDCEDCIADAKLADSIAPKGPLHGLPVAIKDLANSEGLLTSMASPIFADNIAQKDDLFVARMKAAGAIVIGKTNTPEFGLGSHTFNSVHGATRNPYDPNRSAGGSSGGAAAALATGMIPIADGSDMMGSLRNPGAWNNVYGLRPTYGLVPLDMPGDMFHHQLAVAGPMGRTPQDVALLLDVQAGFDARHPHSFSQAPSFDQLDGDLKGMKLGWLGDWGGVYAMDAGVLETCETSLKGFENLGATVERLAPPFSAEKIWEAWVKLRAWANAAGKAALFNNENTRKLLKDDAIWEIETGMALSAVEVHEMSAIRTAWFAKLNEMFATYDALMLPSAQVWPFPVEWDSPKKIADRVMDTYHRWMEVVIPVSLVGVPSLNIPAGFNEAGLPMGIQVFGPRHSDAKLLKIGQRWHEISENASRRPDLSGLVRR
ncbi:MAG: amidase [Planktotalea sp.]|uniref:amidase n=2 Tax=Planktotalea sp. TaxID=2029877 RepID=UPI00260B2C51|nr:amidase [Planktotalea sp.]MDG1075655.1 amidase [Planktotalea sp.]